MNIRINDEVSFVLGESKKQPRRNGGDDKEKNICALSIRVLNPGTLRKKFGSTNKETKFNRSCKFKS